VAKIRRRKPTQSRRKTAEHLPPEAQTLSMAAVLAWKLHKLAAGDLRLVQARWQDK